jgi:hypothetical protein
MARRHPGGAAGRVPAGSAFLNTLHAVDLPCNANGNIAREPDRAGRLRQRAVTHHPSVLERLLRALAQGPGLALAFGPGRAE